MSDDNEPAVHRNAETGSIGMGTVRAHINAFNRRYAEGMASTLDPPG